MQTELQKFYNEQAKKFSGTRKKHRPEFDILLEEIKKYISTKNSFSTSLSSQEGDGGGSLKILELGCGDGRFYRFLKENLEQDFEYKGIDFSKGLLDIAQKESPKISRICEDMLDFLKKQQQEEYDIIVSVASIQHIEKKNNRNFLIKLIHRSLKYGGKHLSINRSYSEVFRRKFKKEIRNAFLKQILTLGTRDKNNIFIPFKVKDKTYQRLYHIFTTDEIRQITKKNGLILSDCFFVGKNGQKTEMKISRNTFFIQTKDIFVPSI